MALKKGDSGAAVRLAQRCLKAYRSSLLPRYGADGDFGDETVDAVKAYQFSADIPQTGAIDGVTLALLLRYEPK